VRCLDAFDRFDENLESSQKDITIISAVHEALTHATALSHYFWPIRDKGTTMARGQKLQASFGLNDTSPLYDKDLRHALEHFDERLDQFLTEGPVGQFFPNSIIASSSLAEEQVTHIFRLVDPQEKVFVLLGKKYSFSAIRAEVQSIHDKALAMNANGGRLS
jgi:hypothetical protein